MTVQVWGPDGATFLGRLLGFSEITCELSLSEAGTFTASAPYAGWCELLTYEPGFHQVRCYATNGDEVLRGIWLTRDDNLAVPGEMAMAGNDLLEELRAPCLPPDFYVTNYPALEAVYWLLEQSGTAWELGDTGRASAGNVSANLGGQSYLEAVLQIAELSGNYIRHNGVDRLLDVLAEPYTVLAYLRGLEADDEELPVNAGRVVPPISLTVDTGEVLQAVYASGGSVMDKDGNEDALRPKGNEDLPAGFSFTRIRGQVAIVNDSVLVGLIRPRDYPEIEPLSNRTVSVSGAVESTGAGAITCESLRRPNDNFWGGGALEINDTEYAVNYSSGPTIGGSWTATFALGTSFSVKRVFPYDAVAEDDARQDLVNAAVGYLKANSRPAQQLSVTVHGLRQRLAPGDKVRLEWVAGLDTRNVITDEIEKHLLESFYGELVVSSVQTVIREQTSHVLGLVRDLSLLPTDTGVREMRNLIAGGRRNANNRIMSIVGDSEPLQTWPGMIWMDTVGPITKLKIRNASNNAWAEFESTGP
jgi:hypothetical protein